MTSISTEPPLQPSAERGSALATRRSGELAVSPRPATGPTLDVVKASDTGSYRTLKRSMRSAMLVVAAFAAGLTGFLFKTVIAGAVVTQGALVVDSGAKAVQHQTGGTVRRLLVREGDEVKAGQPLVMLDQVVSDAQLTAVTSSLVQSQARLDRLIAERDGAETPTFTRVSQAMLTRVPDYEHFLSVETRQFELRRESREGQRQQLLERVKQTEEEVNGQQAQLAATGREVGVVQDELEGLRKLFKTRLVPYERVSDMERTFAQLQGRQAELQASLAAHKGRISEIKLQILQVDQNLRSELTDQIAQTQREVSELAERRVIASDAKERSIIVAPQNGVVHELGIHTIGGVIQPAEVLMYIVPEADALVGEVNVKPTDIDQLYSGQDAEIHFSAFDRGTTPTILGKLTRISPDLERDQRSGAAYYKARISVSDEEIKRLGDLKLVPGMPLEVFIKTSDRTIASYLLKPLTDQMNRAFR